MTEEQRRIVAEIPSVPPSRIHCDEDGTVWVEDDLDDLQIICVKDNFAAPLTKFYRLKDSIPKKEAAKIFTDILRLIGVEVRFTRGRFIAMEADGTVSDC